MAFFELSDYSSSGNAVAGDVLKDKTFSNVSGTNKVGTMPDNTTRTSNGNKAGISQSNSNSPVRNALSAQIVTNTDNVNKIALCPPQGYYQGDTIQGVESYIGIDDIGNAVASDVFPNKTFTSENGKNISGTITRRNYSYPRNNEVGYYASGGYGWVHIPESWYGVLDSETWAPEIRLNHQNLFDLIKDSLANFEVYAKYIQNGGTEYTDFVLDYTQSGTIPVKAIFVFIAQDYYGKVADYASFTAKVNNVNQTLIDAKNSTNTQIKYCVCKLNPGDKVYMKSANTRRDDFHINGLIRIQTKNNF